jgi:hypothetical protein
VTLNNGQREWASLSNVDLRNEKVTSHFMTLSIIRDGKWFHLARYFDVDYTRRGSSVLSAFLGFPVQQIFPVRYDIGPYVIGARIPTVGLILEEPEAQSARALDAVCSVPGLRSARLLPLRRFAGLSLGFGHDLG